MIGCDKAKVWMRFTASAFLLIPPAVNASTLKEHSLYCVPREDDSWVVQIYSPLIDTRSGTRIVQATYSGPTLTHVLVKRYTDRYELLYDYKFAEDGKLVAITGYLQRWGRWLAQADLTPDSDGLVPRPQVMYRRHAAGGVIVDPEDGPHETIIFQTVPVYRTVDETPCAVLFQKAEKLNATQE
jgi:hypothetical protein